MYLSVNQAESKDFHFLGFPVRVVTKDADAWFVLSDIAKVLGVINASDMAKTLRENQRSRFNLGRQGEATIINESGLYRILLRSNKPEAEKFQIWVEDEVLPSIRKHGMYATPVTVDQMIANPDFAIELLTKLKEEQQLRKQIQEEKDQIEKEKARLIHTDKTYTATELAKECDMSSANALNDFLAKNGIQYKANGTWVLFAKYANLGLTEIKQQTLTSGQVVYSRRFTGKGREFVLRLIYEP